MDLTPYLDLFVAEARDHLGAACELAGSLGEGEARDAALAQLFRHVHSIKGMAASMGFAAMSALAHDAESLMDRLRQTRAVPEPGTERVLRDALACLERMVDRAERKDAVDDAERAALQDGLRRLLGGHPARAGAAPLDPGGSAGPARAAAGPESSGCFKIAVIVRRDRSFPAVRAAIVIGKLARLGKLVRIDPPMAALRTGRFDGRLAVTIAAHLPARALAARVSAVEEIETFTMVPVEAPRSRDASAPVTASLRVRSDRLDALLEDVLELMSSLGRIDAAGREIETTRRLARRAYDALVEMRLVPFEVASQRLSREADALSRRLGKGAAVEVEGQEVKLDRSLLERIIDPLLHMVRNAVDHGIESAETRKAARKPAVGRVRIRVARLASRLSITVEDDGRGLDPRRLKQTAIERGLLTPAEAVRLADPAALSLITLPGFTTAEETTEVSGRGVGMDVVKTTVEALGGRLRIESRPGRGTRLELALPATVALVQTYVVRAAGMSFAVPLASLGRMASMDDHSTTWRDGRRYWNVGAEEIPVWALRDVLRLHGPAEGRGGMVLIGEAASGATVGIEVEEIVGRREVVVRPLPPPVSGLAGYSGAAVLDDGGIVLVLDPANLPLD